MIKPNPTPPTPEELAAFDRAAARQMQDMMTARRAIEAQAGTAGKIKCPVCRTGTLHWRRAGSRGHIHASCTTEKCVRWME